MLLRITNNGAAASGGIAANNAVTWGLNHNVFAITNAAGRVTSARAVNPTGNATTYTATATLIIEVGEYSSFGRFTPVLTSRNE